MDCICQVQIRALQEENDRLRSQLRLREQELRRGNALRRSVHAQLSQPDDWDDAAAFTTPAGSAPDSQAILWDYLLSAETRPAEFVSHQHRRDADYGSSVCSSGEVPTDLEGAVDCAPGYFTANLSTLSTGLPGQLEEVQQEDEQTLARYDEMLVLDGEHADPAGLEGVVPEILHEPAAPFTLERGFHAPPTLGVLDQYIMAMGSSLKSAVDTFGLSVALCHSLGIMGVLWVVQEAWPQAEHYWKVTASFQGFLDIEMWRNFPCAQTYQAMHPYYRPTQLQLRVPHHPLIDWLPWPELRDKLIEQQDNFPEIEIVCRAAIHNVVAHRRSSKPKQERSGTSFRVWDLCTLEEQSSTPSRPYAARYAAPSSRGRAELISKPRSAQVTALEKAYQLEYDDFCTQKLHSDFFEMFPSLYCDSLASSYTIKQLPGAVKNKPVMGQPKPLDPTSLERLRTKLEQELETG